MATKQSPFTPGAPVGPDLFVGRREEVRRILRLARQAEGGQQRCLFISGERGIGKSSLAALATLRLGTERRFLAAHVLLGGVSQLPDMARRVFEYLLQANQDKPWYRRLVEFFGKRVEKIGFAGTSISLRTSAAELEGVVRNFGGFLANMLRTTQGERAGIVIVLDDIDVLAASADFANWLKSTVDQIAVNRAAIPLLLILAGYPERREDLLANQPSLARPLDVVEVSTLSLRDSREFYEGAFSKVGVSVEEEAMESLCRYAGGLPVFMHEIGEATFFADEDQKIDMIDAGSGVLAAAESIGQKLVNPRVIGALKSERYRGILAKLRTDDVVLRRRELLRRLERREAVVVDNFLRRMKELGVLTSSPEEGPGAYRFTNHLYRIYFHMYRMRAASTQD